MPLSEKIILASSSIRRIRLLEDLGIPFDPMSPEVDEDKVLADYGLSLSCPELAMKLARLKAMSLANKHPDRLCLGADTLVTINGRVLGKPKNKEQATEYLRMLSGTYHQVITGFSWICLKDSFDVTDHTMTGVTVVKLSDGDIKEYLSRENVLDASGAYKIQSFFRRYIKKISGSFHNVVGLPVSQVYYYYWQYNEKTGK